VERVALDIDRVDLLAAEDLFESSLDRGRARAEEPVITMMGA